MVGRRRVHLLVVIACISLGGVALARIAVSHTRAYNVAAEYLLADPKVAQKFGVPLQLSPGWTFNINCGSVSGSASLLIDVDGSRGSGSARVSLIAREGRWYVERVTLTD